MDDIRYPIGKFTEDKNPTREKREEWIRTIAELPSGLRKTVSGIPASDLDTPYREGGWTARQIVHHIADSQMNAFIRFKFALTADKPALSGFDQEAWAARADCTTPDPAYSLDIIEGLHSRFAVLLSSMTEADFKRTFLHSERGEISLDYNLQLYAWHASHHAAQLEELRKAKGGKASRNP
jgi:hypothetical protein